MAEHAPRLAAGHGGLRMETPAQLGWRPVRGAEEAERDTALETRRYAKRQRTWFRREPGTQFVAPPYDRVWEEAGLSR